MLALFSIAFGYIEGAVVVYLRELYYPDGFRFPLVEFPRHLAAVELVRELATIILLWCAGWLSAIEPIRRFGAFAFCFGLWDLVYYGALKAALGWPATWMEWDILFLIPAPWVGPVLTPMLIAIALCVVGAMLFLIPEERRPRITRTDWLVESLAGCVVLTSFLWNAPAIVRNEPPTSFPWMIFFAGFAGGSAWFLYRWFGRRARPDRSRVAT